MQQQATTTETIGSLRGPRGPKNIRFQRFFLPANKILKEGPDDKNSLNDNHRLKNTSEAWKSAYVATCRLLEIF